MCRAGNSTNSMEIVFMNPRLPRLAAALALLILLPAAAAGCGGPAEDSSASSGDGGTLSLVAYSTPKEAYEELIPAFQKTAQGKGVSFDQSYGSSGDQSRAVASGLPADVVALSLAPDVDKLVEPGLVDANWADTATDGFVTNSVVVFAVRKGNPKNIRTWDDIVEDGVEVITPNPFTSGGAKWNLMAAYGSQTAQGKSPEEALEFLRQVLANTPVQDKSAREALQTFAGGKGDVLLAYENEAITAQNAGIELEYVIPDADDPDPEPGRRRHRVREPGEGEGVRRLAATPRGAGDLRRQGLPLGAARPGRREHLPDPGGRCSRSTSSAAGPQVNDEFFDTEKGSVAQIERDLGVSTAG